ncbi:UNVERIFIED_CONTAM: Mitochondrial inner membrane protein OXA1 [Sesamum calycinum]|uniref:Mitochondrial inner membrane protein OXA1 n=1 Tax=Sesamum calycinum TaxID=2727403 RepID=A0AAW2QVH2_9LAMI
MSLNAVAEEETFDRDGCIFLLQIWCYTIHPFEGNSNSGPSFAVSFFAVRNMAENVPSFKEGGTLWFTDLTTPDSMYILPILTALTFWITVEAIFCYWITSNLFSLTYGLALKKPEVKKFLGLPILPKAPPPTVQKPAFSFFDSLKKSHGCPTTAVRTFLY